MKEIEDNIIKVVKDLKEECARLRTVGEYTLTSALAYDRISNPMTANPNFDIQVHHFSFSWTPVCNQVTVF